MEKLLITGNRGFIGSHLSPFLENYQTKGYDLIEGEDIFHEEIERWIKWSDVVIHLAAKTNVTESFRDAKEHFRINTLGTARILELVMKYNKRLIYPSTGAYYIPDTSPYAKSKKIADDLCQEAMRHIPVTILRFFNIYGNRMNENSGSIIYAFMKEAKENKQITIYEEGKSKRDFINIMDIVQIIKASLSRKWENQIIDCGTSEGYSLVELAEIIAQENSAQIVFDDSKKEINWRLADPTDLRRLYKKHLISNFEKDIKELARNYAATN